MNKKLFAIGLLLPLLGSCNTKENVNVITTREDLISAINHAESGDTIYVGDIDFRIEEQLHKSLSRINLSKGLTIKGVSKNKRAKFTSGSFNLEGTKVTGESLSVKFENIIFDGDIDGKSLTDVSWEYEHEDDIEPRLAQYAMLFKGNITASYDNCDFNNYMNEEGGAFYGLYGDYSGNDFVLQNYGDNSNCKLDIYVDDCNFSGNCSYYGGGAVFLTGNEENVDVLMRNTTFTNNVSSCMEYSQGGGACYLNDVNSEFYRCEFSNNNGSYSYGSTLRDSVDLDGIPPEFIEDYLSSLQDQTSGGAICAYSGECKVIDSLIDSNNASLGGGFAVYNTKLIVDGCVFKENSAMCDLLNDPKDSTGPWSMMGLGGAIYINSSNGIINELWNTSFYNNNARNGYASVYSFYKGPSGDGIFTYPDVKVNFCAFKDNSEVITYEKSLNEWSARPGNVFDISHIKYNACVVCDELSCEYFGKYEKPSVDNNYSYFTNNAHLSSDQVELAVNENGHLKASSKGELSLNIPNKFVQEVLGTQYEGKNTSSFQIGSNYSSNLYKITTKEPKDNTTTIIVVSIVSGLVLVTGITLLIILLKKKRQPKNVASNELVENTNNVNDIILQIETEYKLTSREKEVLTLLLQGKKRAEIAEELFLSESAIKKYTSSIYTKLGVHSKPELIVKYQNKK